jgi:hypothetical protein
MVHISVLILLLGTCVGGFALAMASYKLYLREGGPTGVPSLREQRTPRKRQLASRVITGLVMFFASIVLMGLLGPWKL